MAKSLKSVFLIVFFSVSFTDSSYGVSKKRVKIKKAEKIVNYEGVCALGKSEDVKAGEDWQFIARIKVNKKGVMKSCWGMLEGAEPTKTLLPLTMKSCKVCDRDSRADIEDPECKKLLLHVDKNEIGIIGSYHFPANSPSRVYELTEIGVRPFNSPPTDGLLVNECDSDEPLKVRVTSGSGLSTFSLNNHKIVSLRGESSERASFGQSFFLRVQVNTNSKISHGRLVYSISQGSFTEPYRKFIGSAVIFPGKMPGMIIHGVKQTLLTKSLVELEITLQVPSIYVQAKEFNFDRLELQTESFEELEIDLSGFKPVKILP